MVKWLLVYELAGLPIVAGLPTCVPLVYLCAFGTSFRFSSSLAILLRAQKVYVLYTMYLIMYLWYTCVPLVHFFVSLKLSNPATHQKKIKKYHIKFFYNMIYFTFEPYEDTQ
jgi:hypothetical protein